MTTSAITVTSVTDSVTRILVAVLVLAAAVVVIAGLIRARRGRGRPQLVIADMIDAGWLAESVTPGLSSLLRQQVRRRLSEPSGPSGRSLASTVQPDVVAGLLELRFMDVAEVAQIDADLIHRHGEEAGREVLASQRDELALVAGGIHALAPTRADGLVGAVSVALPPQRGLIVQSTPLAREVGGQCQIGLTLDAGPLGCGPDASATFWSDSIPADDTTDKDLAQRTKLLGLLQPAATWIALYVVGKNLTVKPLRGLSRGMRRRHRDGIDREREALRAILTAQLAGYEMNQMLDRPAAALGFSEQALEDAHRAMRALPGYHRPHYIVATVHDHRGTCYDILQQGEVLEPTATVLDTYRAAAATSYLSAEESFRKAEHLLTQGGNGVRGPRTGAAERLEGVRIRRLKAALRGSDPPTALDELDEKGVSAATPGQHYNAACLYCAALVVSTGLHRRNDGYRSRAIRHLAETLVDRPEYAGHMITDPELAIGLDRTSIEALCATARSPRIAELATQDRDRALSALLDACPTPAPPPLPRQALGRRATRPDAAGRRRAP